MTHGDRNATIRHVGDLGNLETDIFGVSNFDFTDTEIVLTGSFSIVGRGCVVHQNVDDLGMGNSSDSNKSGASGPRIACGTVGLAAPPPTNST